MVGNSVGATVGVLVGALVGVGVGVLIGAASCCRVALHPANRLAAVASFMKPRLEMPRGHALSLWLFSLIVIDPFCSIILSVWLGLMEPKPTSRGTGGVGSSNPTYI